MGEEHFEDKKKEIHKKDAIRNVVRSERTKKGNFYFVPSQSLGGIKKEGGKE